MNYICILAPSALVIIASCKIIHTFWTFLPTYYKVTISNFKGLLWFYVIDQGKVAYFVKKKVFK